MPMIAVQVGLLGLLLLVVLAGVGLLVASLVVFVAAYAGLPGALALAGLGMFLVAMALALMLRRQARATRSRRSALASTAALAKLALLLLPRTFHRQLEVGVAAGLATAALVALLVQPDRGSDD